MSYGIRFCGCCVCLPSGCDKRGWLLNPMTGEPKEFDTEAAAERYGNLSFRFSAGFNYPDFNVTRINKEK